MRLALVAAVLAAAIGGGHASAAAAPATQLRVTIWHQGQPGPSQTWTLACAPARGTHPARGRACQTLSRLLPQPFRPVPRDAMCTQIYGGPQEALVTGTLNGSRVWARFNLRDGCQIARWTRLAPLLPAARGS
jgi:hypothetical protein